MPVVRPADWVKSLPPEMIANTIYEPFIADLVWVYVVDEGGSVRGVTARDLDALGVTRQKLEESAKKNLAAALPAPSEPLDCSAHRVQLLNTNDYYESSRLLLSDFWADLARQSQGSLYAAVPTPGVVLVTCDPARAVLEGLPAVIAKIYAEAERPISRSLFKWSAHGWQEVAPSRMAAH